MTIVNSYRAPTMCQILILLMHIKYSLCLIRITALERDTVIICILQLRYCYYLHFTVSEDLNMLSKLK